MFNYLLNTGGLNKIDKGNSELFSSHFYLQWPVFIGL